MGWGLDLVWPKLIESQELRLGIVDATPVAHKLRKTLMYYQRETADGEMQELLQACPHISFAEAFTVTEAYA
jgi:hypothetical protein